MAINLDLQESQYGTPFMGAYFRIATAAISRTRDPELRHRIMIDVAGYTQKPVHDDVREVDFRRYHVALVDVEAMPGDGIISKSYAWVMQQDDMAGSVAA